MSYFCYLSVLDLVRAVFWVLTVALGVEIDELRHCMVYLFH
jgi:hypothetical protein